MDTISMQLIEDHNGSGTPNWGDVVKPVISTDTEHPWVELVIEQNRRIVGVRWQGMFDGALGDPDHWPLYSPQYVDGPAEAIFVLWATAQPRKKDKPLATVSFHVEG